MHRKRLIVILIICQTVSSFCCNAADSFSSNTPIHSIFKYSKDAPLNYKESFLKGMGNAIVSDISFSGKDEKSIVAYLVKPEKKGIFPAVIYLHWGQGNRDEFLEEAVSMSEYGIVSILLNAPWFRPDYKPVSQDEGVVQIVTDIMRTVDLLYTFEDVDKNRIAFVGHSYGATNGGIIAGVEKRIKCFVLMTGYARASKYTPKGYSSPREELDGIHFVNNSSPSAIFFQFAINDEYVYEIAAHEFYNAAGTPKKIAWYDSGHVLNESAQNDRITWLRKQFGSK